MAGADVRGHLSVIDPNFDVAMFVVIALVDDPPADDRAFLALHRTTDHSHVTVDARALLQLDRSTEHSGVSNDTPTLFDRGGTTRDDEIPRHDATNLRRSTCD